MLIVKFSKIGQAAYIPHLDTLRAFTRTLKRAEVSVKMSEGFNPHPCLYFSNPIPLGLETMAEYCAIDTDECEKDFILKFNNFSPVGLKCNKAVKVIKNPNFANILSAAEYQIEIENLKNHKEFISGILNKPFIFDYKTKTQTIKKDFRPLIYKLSQDGDIIECVFSSGKENLRHDIFIDEILRLTKLNKVVSVLKTAQFYSDNNKLINADAFFG
ncbi:MAG: TIGR03936 family radical SAM-associated protein [Firmicutes bacterium]|nr:TIGR03936 family radical SAM-associated protein [Bacillota bacterium]